MKISSLLVIIAAILLVGCKDNTDTTIPGDKWYPRPLVPTWSEPENITMTPEQSYYPTVVIDSRDVVHLVWCEALNVRYANSLNWNVTTDIEDCHYYVEPSIGIDGQDCVHVAWAQGSAGSREIYYACSNEWTNHTNISKTGAGNSVRPSLSVDPMDIIRIAWSESYEIFLAEHTDWVGSQINISNTFNRSRDPKIVVDSAGTIHIAWREENSRDDIYYVNSLDNFSTWTKVTNQSTHAKEFSMVVDSRGVVHFAWHVYPHNLYYNEIYYLNSKDWDEIPTNISDTLFISGDPAMAVDSRNVVHMVWKEDLEGTNKEIFYVNSRDWVASRCNISNSPGISKRPAIAIDENDVIHIFWQETSLTDITDIFHVMSQD